MRKKVLFKVCVSHNSEMIMLTINKSSYITVYKFGVGKFFNLFFILCDPKYSKNYLQLFTI